MIKAESFAIAMISGLVKQLEVNESSSEVDKMKFACERIHYEYLNSSPETRLELLNSMKVELLEIQAWCKAQEKGINLAITTLESQEKQD
tara:strand:- start:249 stop:518 length:270 start_codon:yes stop_codon:yes gene_type:complete